MKKLISIVFAYYLSAGSNIYASEKACFEVKGMTCATCSLTLKTAVKKLKGIEEVKASVDKGEAAIVFDKKMTSSEQIKQTIDSVGYSAKEMQCKAKQS